MSKPGRCRCSRQRKHQAIIRADGPLAANGPGPGLHSQDRRGCSGFDACKTGWTVLALSETPDGLKLIDEYARRIRCGDGPRRIARAHGDPGKRPGMWNTSRAFWLAMDGQGALSEPGKITVPSPRIVIWNPTISVRRYCRAQSNSLAWPAPPFLRQNRRLAWGKMIDKTKAAGNKVAGEVKDTVGKATGNERLQAEGKVQKAKGAVQDVTGTVKGALGNKV